MSDMKPRLVGGFGKLTSANNIAREIESMMLMQLQYA